MFLVRIARKNMKINEGQWKSMKHMSDWWILSVGKRLKWPNTFFKRNRLVLSCVWRNKNRNTKLYLHYIYIYIYTLVCHRYRNMSKYAVIVLEEEVVSQHCLHAVNYRLTRMWRAQKNQEKEEVWRNYVISDQSWFCFLKII